MTMRHDVDAGLPSWHPEDLGLVKRALAAHAPSLEQLVRRLACVPAMLRERHGRLGALLSRDELAEVEQDTLVSLWAKLREFEGRASLETWAYRFMQNELLKALERRDRELRFVGDPERILASARDREAPEAPFEPAELLECIERVGLPASDIIRMRIFDDMEFEDIARRANRPVNTIKACYYRGLARMRELLAPRVREVL